MVKHRLISNIKFLLFIKKKFSQIFIYTLFRYIYMFKKRAQGLSITTVVVAIIALIVIVVIIAILTGRLGAFGAGLESLGNPTQTCGFQKGVPKETCDEKTEVSIVSSDATAQGKKCCKIPDSKSNNPPSDADCKKKCEDDQTDDNQACEDEGDALDCLTQAKNKFDKCMARCQ